VLLEGKVVIFWSVIWINKVNLIVTFSEKNN